MTGLLAFFCSEWQRTRRIVRLDQDALQELHDCQDVEFEVQSGGWLAKKHGLAGWRLCLDEVAEIGLGLERPSQTLSSSVPTPKGGGPRSPTNKASTVPTLPALSGDSSSSAPPRTIRAPSPVRASPYPGAPLPLRSSQPPTARTRSPAAGGGATISGFDRARIPLAFRNPACPLDGFRVDTLSRDDFVQEMRKRLVVERHFSSSSQHTTEASEPILTDEEAEDLFESLCILQQRTSVRESSSEQGQLRIGRAMDATVEAYFALTWFRQIAERGAATLPEFFDKLDLNKDSYLEPLELTHCIKNTPVEGIDDLQTLTETLLQCMGCREGKKTVNLHRLRTLMALVAPPRLSLTELSVRLEAKYGCGKCGIIGQSLTRTELFHRFCHEELLDVGPEDVCRCFRSACRAPARTGVGTTTLAAASLENMVKQLPLDVSWGVDGAYAQQAFAAFGMRALNMDRARKPDGGLPQDALLFPDESNSPVDKGHLEDLFDRLWGKAMCAPNPLSGKGSAQQFEVCCLNSDLRDACSELFLASVETVLKRMTNVQAQRNLRTADFPEQSPVSLFPNIGDVLAVSSSRLYSGQACLVRFRLQGASNFWHPNHVVLKNGRDPVAWPISRKQLGNSAFIALIAKGAIVGGSKDKNMVEPIVRVDIPRNPTSGLPLMFGHVEIIAPSIERMRRGRSDDRVLSENFELRLFCSSQQKIISWIGEPILVTVIHEALPPPLEGLQVQVEGRNATLRWARLDLHPNIRLCGSSHMLRVCMHAGGATRLFELSPDATEFEIEELSVDTEHVFHARLENQAGAGREVSITFRTNARCSAPTSIQPVEVGTAYAVIRWMIPKVIGNEITKDRFQVTRERIVHYDAILRVQEEEKPSVAGKDASQDPTGVGNARKCQWSQSHWVLEKPEYVSVKLSGLRPDTRYALEDLCAVNSMGSGGKGPCFVFWTMPLRPSVASVRVRNGIMSLSLAQIGGVRVKEYDLSVVTIAENGVERSTNFTLSNSDLKFPSETERDAPELCLPFSKIALGSKHSLAVRAANPGGWSEWSEPYTTKALCKQQGAEKAQLHLIKAIEDHQIEDLTRVLTEVREIELPDESNREIATKLLAKLIGVRNELYAAIESRDPSQLRTALAAARGAKLPSLEEPEILLQQLEEVVDSMATATGIENLRMALESARKVQLPSRLMEAAIDRLGGREAAQFRLEQAMRDARVPPLDAALEAAVGMCLPSESEGKILVERLRTAEKMLRDALVSDILVDFVAALHAAEECGLREETLKAESAAQLKFLQSELSAAKKELKKAVKTHHPDIIRAKLHNAVVAQMPEPDLKDTRALLAKLEAVQKRNFDAAFVKEREAAIEAGKALALPKPLLEQAELQLLRLRQVLAAATQGDIDVLRRTLVNAQEAGCKPCELNEVALILSEWVAAGYEVATSMSRSETKRLQEAIRLASGAGLSDHWLENPKEVLKNLELRDYACLELQEATIHRDPKQLREAFCSACDAEVLDYELLGNARSLIERLQLLRFQMGVALDIKELLFVQDTFTSATTHPALREEEVQPLSELLDELRLKEADYIHNGLRDSIDNHDWRMVEALLQRAKSVAGASVVISETLVEAAKAASSSAQEEDRLRYERELAFERQSRSYMSCNDELPEPRDRAQLPLGVVTGEIVVTYEPSGKFVAAFPREIVEGTLTVRIEEEVAIWSDAYTRTVLDIGEQGMQELLRALVSLVEPMDSVLDYPEEQTVVCREGCVFQDRAQQMELPGTVGALLRRNVAIYLRAGNDGHSVVTLLTSRGGLSADIWTNRTTQRENEASHGFNGEGIIHDLVGSMVEQVVKGSKLPRSPRCTFHPQRPRENYRLVDAFSNLRTRMLRRVLVELSWRYPRGLLDVVDFSCFVFDEEKFLDVVDQKFVRGGWKQAHMRPAHPFKDDTIDLAGAVVRLPGPDFDYTKRCGKQFIELRLDWMPNRVEDLVFVASTFGKDFAKFDDLTITFYDKDTMRALSIVKTDTSFSDEACVMCSIYRLNDRLWRVNSFGCFSSGSSRDYKPIISKLHLLGFPRHTSLRQQVPTILASIQRQLELDNDRTSADADALFGIAKAAGITMARSSATDANKTAMILRYAIELFGAACDRGASFIDEMAKSSFRSELVCDVQVTNPTFCDRASLTVGDRFTESHFEMRPGVYKKLRNFAMQASWVPPSKDRHHNSFYVDMACALFEGKGLREVVDCRGPHGVRLVQGGVLDYGGAWVGQIAGFDASGGSVSYGDSLIDHVAPRAQQSMVIKLDKLPEATSDLIFFLSSPFNCDLAQLKELRVRLLDLENHAHEVAHSLIPVPSCKAQGLCELSLGAGAGVWRFAAIGSKLSGNAKDYRPTLSTLRAFQAKKYLSALVPWPSVTSATVGHELGQDTKWPILPSEYEYMKVQPTPSRGSERSALSIWVEKDAKNAELKKAMHRMSEVPGRRSSFASRLASVVLEAKDYSSARPPQATQKSRSSGRPDPKATRLEPTRSSTSSVSSSESGSSSSSPMNET